MCDPGCRSRRVIDRAIDEHMRADLVESALAMAVAMRGEPAETVMAHADRGCQYTSAQPARCARGHTLTHSVGRIGVLLRKHCSRMILGHRKSQVRRPMLGPTRIAPKLAVGDWIWRIYNRRRRPGLGVLSPTGFKNRTHSDDKIA